MRKVRWALLAGLVWAACARGPGAATLPLEDVTLKAGDYTMQWVVPRDGSYAVPMRSMGAETMPRRPDGLKGGPAEGAAAVYAAVRLGGAPKPFTIALEESQGAGKGIDTLYADTNGDGDLSDEQKVSANPSQQSVASSYRYVTFPVVDFTSAGDDGARRMPVQISHYSFTPTSSQIIYRSVGYWQGEIDSDRGKVKIALTDGSGKGRYDQRSGPGAGGTGYTMGTMMCLFQGEAGTPGARSIQYLGTAQLIGGKLYRFTPSTIGDRMVVAPYTGPAGSVRVALASQKGVKASVAGISLIGAPGYFYTTAGSVKVPAETYESVRAMVTCPGEGGDWQAVFACPRPVTIGKNKTLDLKVGGKLTARLSVASSAFTRGQPAAATLDLMDQYGHPLSGLSGGKSGAPFTMTLTDDAGKQIAQQRFSFG